MTGPYLQGIVMKLVALSQAHGAQREAACPNESLLAHYAYHPYAIPAYGNKWMLILPASFW
jgi:hypothetical protein